MPTKKYKTSVYILYIFLKWLPSSNEVKCLKIKKKLCLFFVPCCLKIFSIISRRLYRTCKPGKPIFRRFNTNLKILDLDSIPFREFSIILDEPRFFSIIGIASRQDRDEISRFQKNRDLDLDSRLATLVHTYNSTCELILDVNSYHSSILNN